MTYESHPLVELAKTAVESYLLRGETISPPFALPAEFSEKKAGVFVTVKKNGKLRGCIGTIQPARKSLGEEIVSNAISAATKDNRFDPITREELSELSFEIYILHEPVQVKSLDELDPKVYGIIVQSRRSPKCGLLLPGLDGIDAIEDQILVAAEKGGIDVAKDEIAVFKFTADKF